MTFPFSTEQFLEVFRQYNSSVWPLQIIFYILAILMVWQVWSPKQKHPPLILLLLGGFWLWMGIVYHFVFFTSINKAAWLFGIMNIVQGILFIFYGIKKNGVSFRFPWNIYSITGIILIVYSLVFYPLIGHFSGHSYPYSPTFGLPCPTTIFSFGMLLLIDKRVPLVLLIIPFLWSVIGTFAALSFGIREDIGLIISGLITCVLIICKNKK